MTEVSERILCVDDEPLVLEALQRQLKTRFTTSVATSGSEALELLQREGPFAVVVCDMRMPGMDGASLLARVRTRWPDTVRILLSGQADIEAAVQAINRGGIYRFLLKPCTPPELQQALQDGLRQYRLAHAERELLDRTLRGSVRSMVEVLALSAPNLFGLAERVQRTVHEILAGVSVTSTWDVDVAALLCRIGAITMPSNLLEAAASGTPLQAEDQRLIDTVPHLSESLLEHIPRLDKVREIIRYHQKNYDGSGPPEDGRAAEMIPLASRCIKIALDLDALESKDVPRKEAITILRQRTGMYDPALLDALEVRTVLAGSQLRKAVMLQDLRIGMILETDVWTRSGTMLVSRGHEVTVGLMVKLQNCADRFDILEPLHVLIPEASS